MSWYLAHSLVRLRAQVDAGYPGRPKGSDGTIGDAEHSSRQSDHNPTASGAVCAIDLTEWVQDGIEMNDVLTECLRAQRDPRLKYVISDGRMFSSYATAGRRAWEWGPYSGVNAHTKHAHISVHGSIDDDRPWSLTGAPGTPPVPAAAPPPTEGVDVSALPVLRKPSQGQHVRNLQGLLVAHGSPVVVDGDFGAATERALTSWQGATGSLTPDGVAGPLTWARLIGV
ncbi:MAG: Peptidoglycan-binding domain 1 protein [Frankiales bacterium]|nr:Peptidoglycan-binding domain 1 protein [Frankiales bacterium]